MPCSGCPSSHTVFAGVKNIARGYAYLASGVNDELSEQRLKHCRNCAHLRGGIACDLCGCAVQAKTRLPQESCPLKEPKWTAQAA